SPQAQPQPQPQPQQAADFPMSLLQEALDACATLTRRVEHLEYDKVVQALEITKLRVKKLEKGNKEEDKKVEEAKVDESAQVQGRQAKSQAKIYRIDMDHASNILSMQEDEPTEVQEVVDVVSTAKLITKVVTAASETVTAASTKEQIEEEESRALQRINETSAERAAKRIKLDEDVKDLKRHLEIVPNEDDDVYTKATPLARKL
nr:hypothetical protein [Tanacetum cinerariifolium]